MKKIIITILLAVGCFALVGKPVAAFEAHTIGVVARIELPEDFEPPEKDLSHWVLGLCEDQKVKAAYPEYEDPHTDPTSGVYGIKWDTPESYEENKDKSGATYVVELNGWWELGDVEVAVKAGPDPVTGEIWGASCSRAESKPSAPDESDVTSLDGWKIVLLRVTYTDEEKTIVEYWVGPADQDSPEPYSEITLNEFFPDPSADTTDEWVRLYNLGGSGTDVDGWFLYDEDDQDLEIDDGYTDGSTVVPSGGTLRINRNGSSFSLDNDGDVIRLYDGDKDAGGKLMALVRYFDSIVDKSWKRDPNGYGVWIDPVPSEDEEVGGDEPGPEAFDLGTIAVEEVGPENTEPPLPGGSSEQDESEEVDGSSVPEPEDESPENPVADIGGEEEEQGEVSAAEPEGEPSESASDELILPAEEATDEE